MGDAGARKIQVATYVNIYKLPAFKYLLQLPQSDVSLLISTEGAKTVIETRKCQLPFLLLQSAVKSLQRMNLKCQVTRAVTIQLATIEAPCWSSRLLLKKRRG
jgi:hypothetical protein